MSMRGLIFAVFLFLFPVAVSAEEAINDFNVAIEVEKSGDIVVTETISVTSEGRNIRRGIFRDLPRYYLKGRKKLAYDYDVNRVVRDGREEPFAIERDGNAFRIRIGDEDVYLRDGAHVYEIEYEVKNQIRYFDDYDEIYWNATGNYWNFPIEKARAVITLPEDPVVLQMAAYTGYEGETGSAFDYDIADGARIFTTTRPLAPREGLSVAVGFEKGAVDPPSAADKRAEWWTINASIIVLVGALGLLSLFYWRTYHRVGRDPSKGPVFPRYELPEGYSPAAVHHIFHRRFAGHKALIAALLNLAIKGRIQIDAKDKKKTTLTRLEAENKETLGAAEADLALEAFNGRKSITLGEGYDSNFTHAYEKFRKQVGRDFGKPFFKWNAGFLILGIILSVVAIVIAIVLSVGWTFWHTGAVAALIALSAVFSYFLPAPTDRGQEIRTEIEGLKLYLEKAEKLQLNAAKPGSNAPPPMSVERYERFLPYAVALGVEEPWTRHFERLIPEEARDYQPRWAHMHGRHYGSLHGLNRSLVSSMSSGVSSALPQSSSSSGSGGGGFSGGGGGGGGGGGW